MSDALSREQVENKLQWCGIWGADQVEWKKELIAHDAAQRTRLEEKTKRITELEEERKHWTYERYKQLEQQVADLTAKLEAAEQERAIAVNKSYDHGYQQGLDDGHRCERRHERLDELETSLAAMTQERDEAMTARDRATSKAELWEGKVGDLEDNLAAAQDEAGRLREVLIKCRRELWYCNRQLVSRGAHEGASVTEALAESQQALTPPVTP